MPYKTQKNTTKKTLKNLRKEDEHEGLCHEGKERGEREGEERNRETFNKNNVVGVLRLPIVRREEAGNL
jgi:flagellar biosynthesis/type III secretory pathway protein FliH